MFRFPDTFAEVMVAYAICLVLLAGLLTGCGTYQGDNQPDYTLQNALMRQALVNQSLETYNRMASPCGINVPCRGRGW